MYLGAAGLLREAGYHHYEIANFALPGSECRHNLNYWDCGRYVGLGAGAFSYLDGRRFGNTADVAGYCARLEAGEAPTDSSESLEPRAAARERLMLAMRTTAGVHLEEFRQRSGFDALEVFGKSLETHMQAGRLTIEEGRLRLTLEGILVANTVMADFI
jgi:oxygen-independent coproporphyrinogen-3 oxidase